MQRAYIVQRVSVAFTNQTSSNYKLCYSAFSYYLRQFDIISLIKQDNIQTIEY